MALNHHHHHHHHHKKKGAEGGDLSMVKQHAAAVDNPGRAAQGGKLTRAQKSLSLDLFFFFFGCRRSLLRFSLPVGCVSVKIDISEQGVTPN